MSNALRKSSGIAGTIINKRLIPTGAGQGSSSLTGENTVLPKEKMMLLNALEYLAKLDDDWNGQRAIAPSQLAVFLSRHFIERLPLNKAHASKIEPDGDGAVVLTWVTADERILLTIDGSLMHPSHEKQNQPTVYINDVPFFDLENNFIPAEILGSIPSM